MIVHQAVHGYAGGHALLGCSTELTGEEQRDLDALSDQSGTTGRRLEYDHYDTGYPTGRWYVYARTWRVADAVRQGTVVTHSLLIPVAELGDVSLPALANLFQRPRIPPGDHASSPLELPAGPPAMSPPLREPTLASLVASWFYRDRRPLLWEDTASAGAAVAALWDRLPPSHRSRLTFCTLAIQPRTLGDRLFDWMSPGSDSGAWHRLREMANVASPPDAPALPGFDALLAGPPTLWSEHADVVEALPGPRLRVYLRWSELAPRRDVAGALARLDCVESLGAPAARLAPEAVDRALAALEERPSLSWADVRQLVVRAPHRLAPGMGEETERRLRALMERRVAPASEGFSDLAAAADSVGLSTLVDRAVMDRELRRAPADVLNDLGSLPHVRARLLPVLDAHARAAEIAARCLADPGLGPEVAPWVHARLDRIGWVLAVETPQPGPLRAMLEANPPGDTQAWLRALAPVPPARLVEVLPVAPSGVPRDRALARRLSESPVDDIENLPGPWRAAVYAYMFEERPEHLVAVPERAVALLLAAAEHRSAGRLARSLVEALPAERLVGLAPPSAVSGRPWAERWADHALVASTTRWLSAGSSDAPAWAALASSAGVAALARALAACPDSGLPDAMDLTRLTPRLHESWLLDVLWRGWVERSDDTVVPALSAWVALLNALRASRASHRVACSVAFARAVRGRQPDFAALAVASFPTVHAALLEREYPSSVLQWLGSMVKGDWDRAKHARHHAARAWVQQRWPAESLVELAAGDADLFRRLWNNAVEAGGEGRYREVATLVPPSWIR